jgi:hypothetical protein
MVMRALNLVGELFVWERMGRAIGWKYELPFAGDDAE